MKRFYWDLLCTLERFLRPTLKEPWPRYESAMVALTMVELGYLLAVDSAFHLHLFNPADFRAGWTLVAMALALMNFIWFYPKRGFVPDEPHGSRAYRLLLGALLLLPIPLSLLILVTGGL